MSYSEQEARWEREEAITEALEKGDATKLYELAELEKDEGNDEVAAELMRVVKMLNDDPDRAYDEARDNQI